MELLTQELTEARISGSNFETKTNLLLDQINNSQIQHEYRVNEISSEKDLVIKNMSVVTDTLSKRVIELENKHTEYDAKIQEMHKNEVILMAKVRDLNSLNSKLDDDVQKLSYKLKSSENDVSRLKSNKDKIVSDLQALNKSIKMEYSVLQDQFELMKSDFHNEYTSLTYQISQLTTELEFLKSSSSISMQQKLNSIQTDAFDSIRRAEIELNNNKQEMLREYDVKIRIISEQISALEYENQSLTKNLNGILIL